jgi:hypothetical protein
LEAKRQFYADLETALLRFRAKALIPDILYNWNTGGACAMGVYNAFAHDRNTEEVIVTQANHFYDMGQYQKMRDEWTVVARENNRTGRTETPEDRYTRMLAWTRAQRVALATADELPKMEEPVVA